MLLLLFEWRIFMHEAFERQRIFIAVKGVLFHDGKTLIVYFPTELNEDYEYEKTPEADQKVFHVPDGVTRIAPYAFFECGLDQIYLPSTVTEISDHAFTRSGIAPDLGKLTDYDGNEITPETEGITFGANHGKIGGHATELAISSQQTLAKRTWLIGNELNV